MFIIYNNIKLLLYWHQWFYKLSSFSKKFKDHCLSVPPAILLACHALCWLQVWRQVTGFPHPGSGIYIIYTLSSQWQQETGDITIVFTQCYTQANYWQLTHVLAWLAALMFHDLIPHYNVLGLRMQMVVWSCCYFGFIRSLGQVNGNLASIIIIFMVLPYPQRRLSDIFVLCMMFSLQC